MPYKCYISFVKDRTKKKKELTSRDLFIYKYSNPFQGGFSTWRWSAKQYKNKNNKEDKLKQVNRSVVQSRNAFAKLISRVTVK